jgi:hypothetical protein
MQKLNIDISKYQSKSIKLVKKIHFDLIKAVCDSTNDSYPVYLNNYTKLLHWPFKDLVEKNIDIFRDIRDLIYQKYPTHETPSMTMPAISKTETFIYEYLLTFLLMHFILCVEKRKPKRVYGKSCNWSYSWTEGSFFRPSNR